MIRAMFSAPRIEALRIATLLLLPPLLWSPATAQSALETRIRKALERARPAMLAMSKNTSGGVHALLCLAMAHDDLTLDVPQFAAAIERLERTKLTNTYDLACRLMVMAKLREYPKRRSAGRRDLRALLGNQNGGGFSYRSKAGTWDLSNTQYAALGMRAAASLGIQIAKTRWTTLARAVIKSQVYKGGFGYRPKSGPTPSMTVAGIAILEICRQQINSSGSLNTQLKKAIRDGWTFMVRHKKTIGAGGAAQRNYYFHYGLERAAILSDKDRVGAVDWYTIGARMLLGQESKDGGWGYAKIRARIAKRAPQRIRIGQAPITTAFAVLFLRRSFQRTLTGPITPSRNVLARALPAQANDKLIAATIRLEISRGYRGVPDLILAMRSPILARRKVAAKALPAITNRFRSYSPYHTPAQSADLIKGAERWWLREGRKRLD
jgi:hypothetical protein